MSAQETAIRIPGKSKKDRFLEDAYENDEETAILNESSNSNRSEKALFLEEPTTHKRNLPFLIRLCICWTDRKNQLSKKELTNYNKLKEIANTTFDAKCEDYDDLLRELFEILTGETIKEIPNERWKDYGFQNPNPRSDFRGAGLLALKQLISFAEKYLARIKFMITKEKEFLLAISSVSTTYFLEKYYHLPKFLVFEKDQKDLCSRVALKSFCTMLASDSKVLDKIHSLLLNDLYDTWQDIRKQVPGVNLLDFSMAQDTIKRKFIDVTKGKNYSSFEELRDAYVKAKVKLPTERPSLKGFKK